MDDDVQKGGKMEISVKLGDGGLKECVVMEKYDGETDGVGR